jgi:hypothetical protein
MNNYPSLFVSTFNWGTDKLAELNVQNDFGNSLTPSDKIDMIIGADIVFWPASLDPLMQTLNVMWNNRVNFHRKL